jgi:polysaccharide biosynthesis protein PelA
MKRRDFIKSWPTVLLPLSGRGVAPAWSPDDRLYIDYRALPSTANLKLHSHCVVDALAQIDWEHASSPSRSVLAYISLVELAPGSTRESQAKEQAVKLRGKNEAWSSSIMDVGSDEWESFMWESCITPAVRAGFSGLFFDTVDSIELLPQPSQRTRAQSAVKKLLHWVKKQWPKQQIWLNRGFQLLPQLVGAVDAVLVESVYQTFDPTTRKYSAVPAQGSQWLETHIRKAQDLGLRVCTVDYVSPAQLPLALSTLKRLQALDTLAFITTPELQGKIIAPIVPQDAVDPATLVPNEEK